MSSKYCAGSAIRSLLSSPVVAVQAASRGSTLDQGNTEWRKAERERRRLAKLPRFHHVMLQMIPLRHTVPWRHLEPNHALVLGPVRQRDRGSCVGSLPVGMQHGRHRHHLLLAHPCTNIPASVHLALDSTGREAADEVPLHGDE